MLIICCIKIFNIRNNQNQTTKDFINALRRKGVEVEPVRNRQNKVYGIRFKYKGETFKASEIGKEFGFRSLFLHYGQKIDEHQRPPKHFEKQQYIPQQQTQRQSTAAENIVSAVGGLLNIPPQTSDYDPDEAALQRQHKYRKKKK